MRQLAYANTTRITKEGERFYQKELKEKLEPQHTGEYVVIDPESQEYFLGESPVEANRKAKEKYPEKVFYLKRVGHESAFNVPHLGPATFLSRSRI